MHDCNDTFTVETQLFLNDRTALVLVSLLKNYGL